MPSVKDYVVTWDGTSGWVVEVDEKRKRVRIAYETRRGRSGWLDADTVQFSPRNWR